MKALDNIRNSEAGHIMIDYRIACAMINYSVRPCNPDLPNPLEVARKLRKASENTRNKLKFLLKPRLNIARFRSVNFDAIKNEFPKLTKKEIEKKISLGTYHVKLSKSYIE